MWEKVVKSGGIVDRVYDRGKNVGLHYQYHRKVYYDKKGL
jgi:hypothetical protein